jgi:hypothetical protein
MKTGFGWIEIEGKEYDHDIVIHADGSITKRKKKLSKPLKGSFGHTPLSEQELDFLDDEHPDVVYIGTGQYGSLPFTPGAEKLLSGYNTTVMPTGDILPALERDDRRYVAILHVTC